MGARFFSFDKLPLQFRILNELKLNLIPIITYPIIENLSAHNSYSGFSGIFFSIFSYEIIFFSLAFQKSTIRNIFSTPQITRKINYSIHD